MDLANADVFGSMYNPSFLDHAILHLGDVFEVRIACYRDMAVLSGLCTVSGGLMSVNPHGMVGAAVGEGLGSPTGIGVAAMVNFRELWESIKDELVELRYIVYNYLRRQDTNLASAFLLTITCHTSSTELVISMLNFIAMKLGRQVSFYV